MRKYILPSALILAFGLALAWAQNINKAIQLSQDPTGVIGVDVNNNVYFPAHVLSAGQNTAPVVNNCGTSPAITGTDTAGVVTYGTGSPSQCLITFNKPYLSTPWCVVSAQTAASTQGYTASANGILLTQTAASSDLVNYFCTAAK